MAIKTMIERRWPVIIACFVVLYLVTAARNSVRAFPVWLRYVVTVIVIISMIIVPLTSASRLSRHVERLTILIMFIILHLGIFDSLLMLFYMMMHSSEQISGVQLLASSVVIWIMNIFIYSLLYWQIDQGGPEERINGRGKNIDWFFPQADISKNVLQNWHPAYVDYLFLSFTTATAFSPTDVLPANSRSKLLMMLESAVSLITIVMVVSRAINILG